MKILVTGGAGYIGSVTVKLLLKEGHEVVVFDNLRQGHEDVVSCVLVTGDLLNKASLDQLKNQKFDAVVHFAAMALAGESMQSPAKYFENNILGGLNLLEFMRREKIPYIIFSSSCAVYGTPKIVPVTENESYKPESVYGESKLIFEKILYWYDQVYKIKHINLRYFNACGAALDGSTGEEHDPETHIIPVAIRSAIKQTAFPLFGKDYNTPDGTCIRDYIHIEDLANAHVLALKKIGESNQSDNFNLGSGHGYSNLEIIDTIEKVSGKSIIIDLKPRRAGDPTTIYADASKAKRELGFETKYSDIKTIIETAWRWHTKNDK